MSRRNGKRRISASHVLVAIHLLLIFVPISTIFVWAFADSWPWPDLVPPAFSLRGFSEATSSTSKLGDALFNSVALALLTALISTVAAALAARALVHHDFAGKEAFHFVSTIPFLVPTMVFAMGIQILFMRLGLTGNIFGVALSHSAVALPYALAIMVDTTSALGRRLEEQSMVLGASKFQSIFTVALPQLAPGLLAAAAIAYIESMVQYFLTLFLGSGKVMSITTYMYPFLSASDRTVAAMYALVFLLVSTVVFLVLEAIVRHFDVERQGDLYT